ncbi:MAG TPA: sugar ABC transporter permease [Ktedonobacteraceae bacterium]
MSSVMHIDTREKSSLEQETVTRPGTWRKYLPMYLSIAPFYILFLVFGIVPTFFSLYLAFQKWDGIGAMSFVGLSNFAYVFTDPIFGQAVANTFEIWFMSTIPMLFIALVLAFLINQRKRSKIAYEIAYYIPVITSIVAITLIFGSLLDQHFGLINQALTAVHLSPIMWTSEAWPMRWAVALLVIWRWTGANALIYMAGLQSIPSDFYEAARIDGAGTWQVFFHVTIPLLRPIVLFTVITSTIGGLTLFTEPQNLFGNTGGTGHEGLTMSVYQYWQTFPLDHYGFGAAVSWVMFFIILAFSIFNWNVIQRSER